MLSPITGQNVPLSLFVKVDPTATSSLTVSHQGEYPAATLSFNLAPGVALSQATKAVQAARDKLGAPVNPHRLLPGDGAGLPAVAGQSSRS